MISEKMKIRATKQPINAGIIAKPPMTGQSYQNN